MSITFEVYHCLSFHKDALNNVCFFFTCLKNMGLAARKPNIVSCEQQRRWPVCTDWSAPLLLAFETWYRLQNFHILTSVRVLLCWKPWNHFYHYSKKKLIQIELVSGHIQQFNGTVLFCVWKTSPWRQIHPRNQKVLSEGIQLWQLFL